jgi:penicillin-binding protein 1A
MRRITGILLSLSLILAVIIGVLLGLALAGIRSFQTLEDLDVSQSALPTQIYDINGELITEFFQDEKREIVPIEEIPQHLIDAIITREDKEFYGHAGYNLKAILRAAWGYTTGNYQGGASSITQQVAGNKYLDRTEITLRRKLVELWYALQLEKRYTKNEILEFYLNEMPFGGGTNGVEAASKYYFKKSVRDITLAESVLLAITLSSHTKYSPLRSPELARERQREILDQMVALGYASQEEADGSFREYWENYDHTRYASYGAALVREDKAPWFSEYIRFKLGDLLLGSQDIYRGGLKVYTTLNLKYQRIADEVMAQAIPDVDRRYRSESDRRVEAGDDSYAPLIDVISLAFNIPNLHVPDKKKREQAEVIYHEEINPVMDLMSSLFGIEPLVQPSVVSYGSQSQKDSKTEVEGALVAIDSHTGHILAMVGGSEFSYGNQFNRAVQGGLQPGSAFKPLYYSAAIESEEFTPATMIIDRPVVFWNDDGTPYTPENYKGNWGVADPQSGLRRDQVLLRTALARSMNVASLKVLAGIGFDAAISRAAHLLGITDPEEITDNFPRKWPLGLGIVKVSPLQMARAFATFPNQGREIEPVAIRYITDRNGRTILEPAKEALERQKRKEAQIMSPKVAYIMTDILQSVVNWGTLRYGRLRAGGFERPVAGKTGTTQNWEDAWTVGFTPQVTTAVWFGFDMPWNSLGTHLTGATAGGPVWAEFMKRVHEELPVEEFPEPKDGIVEVEICRVSGLLPHPEGYCEGATMEEIFLAGTEPRTFCTIHKEEIQIRREGKEHIKSTLLATELFAGQSPLLALGDLLAPVAEEQGIPIPTSDNPLLD